MVRFQGDTINIPIIMTCTVKIQDSSAKVSSSSFRLEEYRMALNYWIDKGFKKIYILENSGIEIITDEIFLKAKMSNCTLKQVNISATEELIRIKGKGYGEGEMLLKFLEGDVEIDDYFVKVTGRIIILNCFPILETVVRNKLNCLFYRNSKENLDTRFYVSRKDFYMENLAKAHLYVDDKKCFYLENSFSKSLSDLKKKLVSTAYPVVRGISGSTGESYQLNRFKLFIKSIMCKFGLIAEAYK